MTGLPQVIRSIEIPSPPRAVWRWLATQDGRILERLADLVNAGDAERQ